MSKAMMKSGFGVDLYSYSTSQKHPPGAKRKDLFGNTYRYAYTQVALTAGYMTKASIAPANLVNINSPATAVNGKLLTVTISAAAANVMPADALKGGQLHVNDGASQGFR